jgi:hypothetical protein
MARVYRSVCRSASVSGLALVSGTPSVLASGFWVGVSGEVLESAEFLALH